MSLTATIAILAVVATVAAAFPQPVVSLWLAPKQKLCAEITASEYAIPLAISAEMSNFYYNLRTRGQPRPEFGNFLKQAEYYRSYFDVTIANTGKTVSRNVILGCSANSKYVLIHSRNKVEYHPDQTEYFIGDLQPSEKINIQIWRRAASRRMIKSCWICFRSAMIPTVKNKLFFDAIMIGQLTIY